jgi:hypothetical protein
MTQEEFIKLLNRNGYSYEMEGDKIIVTAVRDIWLNSIQSIPPNVVFNNRGNVLLDSITSIPYGVEFNNGGIVSLDAIVSISPVVKFNNTGVISLRSLTGNDLFREWQGNIEGIHSTRLANLMISKKIFEK